MDIIININRVKYENNLILFEDKLSNNPIYKYNNTSGIISAARAAPFPSHQHNS